MSISLNDEHNGNTYFHNLASNIGKILSIDTKVLALPLRLFSTSSVTFRQQSYIGEMAEAYQSSYHTGNHN